PRHGLRADRHGRADGKRSLRNPPPPRHRAMTAPSIALSSFQRRLTSPSQASQEVAEPPRASVKFASSQTRLTSPPRASQQVAKTPRASVKFASFQRRISPTPHASKQFAKAAPPAP